MAQSELTVTPPNPTPPTNMSFVGATDPNPPNYTKTTYADPKNWGGSTPTSPPPFADDGTAASLTVFAANSAAPASGSGASAGGNEGSYPGTGSPPYTKPDDGGAVPASTSVPHEGAGTEIVATLTYPPAYTGAPVHNPTITVGTGPVQTAATIAAGPNANHPSAKAPSVLPTITALTPSAPVSSGGGTTPLTVTGTGFRPNSQITVGGVPQTTNYISATSLSTLNAPKRASAGTTPITVVTGGTATAATNWTFT